MLDMNYLFYYYMAKPFLPFQPCAWLVSTLPNQCYGVWLDPKYEMKKKGCVSSKNKLLEASTAPRLAQVPILSWMSTNGLTAMFDLRVNIDTRFTTQPNTW